MLDILLGHDNVYGFRIFNYFHQKLQLRSLRVLICLCIYLVLQFWRWINEISKVCFEETQKKGNKYFVSENSSSKNFVNIQEKHSREIAYLSKVAGYLTLSGVFATGFHIKHPPMTAFAISYPWKMFRPKYIFQKICHLIFLIYVLIFNGICS